MAVKSKRIQVRLTEAERALIESRANATHLSISDYIKLKVFL